MLVPIPSAEKWNANWIEGRALNFLQLAWDVIDPWLKIENEN